MLASECPSNHSQLPGEALGKNNGNKRKQRSQCRPPEPPVHLRAPPGACCPRQPLFALPAQVQLQGQAAAPALSPRVPGVTSGDSFAQSIHEEGPAPPIPTPSLNVSSSICRCREGERRKNARARGSINQRRRRMRSTAPSRGSAPLTGTSSAAPARPCCTPSLRAHPKAGEDNLAARDLPAFCHSILPIYSGSAELPRWDSGAVPAQRISAQVSQPAWHKKEACIFCGCCSEKQK